MIDGCPDGWAGGIPVCVLSGSAQQDNTNVCASARAAGKDGTLVKERDYISLGLTGAAPEQMLTSSIPSGVDKMECDNVVLSLGLGPPADKAAAASQEQNTGMVDQQIRLKVAMTSAKPQHFWHESFRVSLSNDQYHQHMVNWQPQAEALSQGAPSFGKGHTSSVPVWSTPVTGRFTVPVPKICTTLALHLWQAGRKQLASGLPANPTTFKVPQAASNVSMPPPSIVNGKPASSQAVDTPTQSEIEQDGNRNKAPVVGWPPVRSFRKNTLQAAQVSNRVSADDLPKSMGGPSSSNSVDVSEKMNGGSNKNVFFVKAKLDGVRICRKVDLKAYASYDGLKGALQDMFQGFVSDNAKLDLLTGKNYVVTHEDKDGDCLLVGDVPWHMFLESSVKSLRIMKAMDATGIGEKGLPKAKGPVNGKPS
ncbi:hypothetical protein GOP47_0007289 [Adiantum capillus-veneris]|uniref:Auxin-responsive protein n=1 Tax=Adiantum capillus-veneris TaxID=13818 RepID=A0A9D4V112_ADICA|nr:hypothetical protein GOP47_0007289 [Adiantum capillus-veneris]